MQKTLLLLIPLLLSLTLKAQNTPASVANDYARFGLNPSNIPEKWEDGIRTTGGKGTYEWWYFDAHLDDSSTVVIVFYTKPFTAINKGLTPLVTIEITRPDGSKITKTHYGEVDEFSASKDSCNTNIGSNYFRGNLKEYEIHFQDDDLNLNAKIKRTTESWRPQTGQMYFNDKDYFAWVVPVPKGEVKLDYTYNNKSVQLNGSCYHDHNWGNKNMAQLINHWYWSRAEIGPYSVIASEIIAEKKFGNSSIVVFNVSKDGKTLADDGNAVDVYYSYAPVGGKLNKDLSDNLLFVYDSPDDDYRYEYYLYREKTITAVDLLKATVKSKFKRGLARLLTGFDGAYFRMTGKAELRVFDKDKLIGTYTSPKAVWELMYFGKANE